MQISYWICILHNSWRHQKTPKQIKQIKTPKHWKNLKEWNLRIVWNSLVGINDCEYLMVVFTISCLLISVSQQLRILKYCILLSISTNSHSVNYLIFQSKKWASIQFIALVIWNNSFWNNSDEEYSNLAFFFLCRHMVVNNSYFHYFCLLQTVLSVS